MSYEKKLSEYVEERRQDELGRRLIKSPKGEEVAIQERVLQEKVNYAFRVNEQIRNCQFAWLNRGYGYQMFLTSVIMLFRMIPDSWKDEQFKKDIKDAFVFVDVTGSQKRGTWRAIGSVSLSAENRTKGLASMKLENYFAIFSGCINLFDRRGVLLEETSNEIVW